MQKQTDTTNVHVLPKIQIQIKTEKICFWGITGFRYQLIAHQFCKPQPLIDHLFGFQY
jgi:hypothetical protein